MPSNEAGVVSVAHPFLKDPLSKVFTEAIAGADQTVVPTVGLRKSTQDSPGDQPAIRQHGQHSLEQKKVLVLNAHAVPVLFAGRPLKSSRLRLSLLLSVHLLPNSKNKPTTDELHTNHHRPTSALLQFSHLRSAYQ